MSQRLAATVQAGTMLPADMIQLTMLPTDMIQPAAWRMGMSAEWVAQPLGTAELAVRRKEKSYPGMERVVPSFRQMASSLVVVRPDRKYPMAENNSAAVLPGHRQMVCLRAEVGHCLALTQLHKMLSEAMRSNEK